MNHEELAEKVGKMEVCNEVIKKRLDELEKRPSLPRWLCKWAGELTLVLVVGAASTLGINWYRLGQLEKNQDRWLENIAKVLAEQAGSRQPSHPTTQRYGLRSNRPSTLGEIVVPSAEAAPGIDTATMIPPDTSAKKIYERLKGR